MTWSRRLLRSRLAMVLLSAALSIAGAELVLRGVGTVDADGQFSLRRRALRPYRPPAAAVRAAIEKYSSSRRSFARYDETLGWAPRERSRSANGMYAYDEHGIRVRDPAIAAAARPAALRVAMFGDSYVHGDDVPHEDTIAPQLEALARGVGVELEVLNFGVFGYGLDQALLRFERRGRSFEPEVVVVGFQANNLLRNVNLIRPLMHRGGGLPFAKPRFVLEAGELRLVGVPTPSPSAVPRILANLPAWERAPQEYFYGDDYERYWWDWSRVACLVYDTAIGFRRRKLYSRQYEIGGPMAELGLAILRRFQRGAEEIGAEFIVVHLPRRIDLRAKKADGRFAYEDLLDVIDSEFPLVRSEGAMLEREPLADLFVGHYSRIGNGLVADAIWSHMASPDGPARVRRSAS